MGLAGSLRELGPLDFASYAFARGCAQLPGLSWHRYRIVAIPVTAMPAMPRGFRWTSMELSNIKDFADILEVPQQAIRHRQAQGMTCLGAWRDERLVGASWITAAPFEEDEVRVRFVPPPGCAWDTGLYVRPEDRGGRAFQALWAATAAWLRGHGLDWTMSRITDHNLASWRAHRRMGAREVGRFAALTSGRVQWSIGNGLRRTRPHDPPPVLHLPTPEAA